MAHPGFRLDLVQYAKHSGLACLILAAILFLCSGFFTGSFAEDELLSYTDPESGVTYTYIVKQEDGDQDGNLEETIFLRGCDPATLPADGVIKLPSVINGTPVTRLYTEAFSQLTGLTEVTIPGSICQIQDRAFKGCGNLKKIVLEDGVKDIRSYAFAGTAVTEMTLPDSVTDLGVAAFHSCNKLTDIRLSENLTALNDFTFYLNPIESLTVPASVASMSGATFSACTKLKEIRVAEDNRKYESIGGVLYTKAGDAKAGQSLIIYPCAREEKEFTVPEGVTDIDGSAFLTARSLEEVNLPDSLVNIGDLAFSWCTNLQTINLPSNLNTIGKSAFESCQKLSRIQLPRSLTVIGDYAFNGSGVMSLVVPGTVHELKEGVFCYCQNLNSVVLEKGVNQIANYAFIHCQNLASVTIPSTVSVIGDMAFENAGTSLAEGQVLTIRGVGDSYARTYAEEKGFAFELMEEPEAEKQTIQVAGKSLTKKLGTKPFSLKARAKTSLSYSSSNPEVATVAEDGRVTIHNTGKTVITVTAAGTTQYKAATKKVSIKVRLAVPTLKAVNRKGRQAKLSWSKVYGATGYEVYVKSPGNKRFLKRTSRSAKVKSITHMGLTKGKTYKYKVRAYRTVGGKRVYSGFSAVKAVRIKR